MVIRTVLCCVATMLALLAGACEDRTQDKAAIKQTLAAYEACCDNKDGAGVIPLLTEGTLDRYGALVKIGLDGDAKRVRALSAMERCEVLLMRLRSSRAELSGLDGRKYVELAVSKGWWTYPPEQRGVRTLEDFRFTGADEASPMMVLDGEWTQTRARFVRANGAWQFDEFSVAPSVMSYYRAVAESEGISVDEAIVDDLAERFGVEVPGSIWDPMPL